MAKTNAEILNQIRDTASLGYQDQVPAVQAGDSGASVLAVIDNYPVVKNEFINALTNKVVKSVFYSKVFSNPLAMLHRGMLPYGASIEQLFVDMATKKGFGENFGSNATDSLIGKEAASVNVRYITKNFSYKYKVSISDEQLKSAFMNASGLGELVAQLTNSAISAAYYDEYSDMKAILKAAAKGKQLTSAATGKLSETDLTVGAAAGNIGQFMSVKKGITASPSALAETIRGLAGRMTFPSDKYNMGKVRQWSSREDLVLLTTPEIVAKLDVNVLAQAFNVSSADVNVRTILVDELPAVTANKYVDVDGGAATAAIPATDVLGVLIDKDFLQAYDTIMTSKQFENGDALLTNIFLHKQGIMAQCYFANAVVLAK